MTCAMAIHYPGSDPGVKRYRDQSISVVTRYISTPDGDGLVTAATVAKAIAAYGIDPEKPSPVLS